MSLDILAFAPHPDDAELGAGGILAGHAALGYAVGVADLTRGEAASNGTPAERAAEAAEAARLLGLAVRHNLALPDGGLRDNEETVHRVAGVIRAFRPRLVLAPWGEGDRHPDHRAAARIVAAAVAFARDDRRGGGPQLLYYFLHSPPRPSFVVDVTAAYGRKEAALGAYRSQFAREAGRVATPINDPAFLQGMRARDASLGTAAGAGYGEGLLALPLEALSAPRRLTDLGRFLGSGGCRHGEAADGPF